MIQVEEARQIIKAQAFNQKIQSMLVAEAAGKVLAKDVYAPMDIPAFRQSSMDGYAFRFGDWKPGARLDISGEVPAGKQEKFQLAAGTAARIFTGAALPEGADTVVMQERVMVEAGTLTIEDPDIGPGAHMREKGAEIQAGQVAMKQGTLLGPGALGFLLSIGVERVMVYQAPSVAVIVTGDELQAVGKPLRHGQVYEASSGMLKSALLEMGISEIGLFQVADSLEDTRTLLSDQLDKWDVILLTGGVSVGDYDFVVKATQLVGVQQLFHRIKQRPGKPLFFGRKDQTLVFGLPGNPSSVLTCFYEYVWPLLQRWQGKPGSLKTTRVPLTNSYDKNNSLTQFLKGYYVDGKVTILGAQESFRLLSYSMANCLVVLPEEALLYAEGERVEIHGIPGYC